MMEKAVSIRRSIEKIAHLKDRALLSSFGINSCSDEESSSESDDKCVSPNIREKQFDSIADKKTESSATGDVIDSNSLACNKERVEGFNVHQALNVCKACKLNWFELVTQLS